MQSLEKTVLILNKIKSVVYVVDTCMKTYSRKLNEHISFTLYFLSSSLGKSREKTH